jgi:hypothetical protein
MYDHHFFLHLPMDNHHLSYILPMGDCHSLGKGKIKTCWFGPTKWFLAQQNGFSPAYLHA